MICSAASFLIGVFIGTIFGALLVLSIQENMEPKEDSSLCDICSRFKKVKTREGINDYCLICMKKYIFGNQSLPDKEKND